MKRNVLRAGQLTLNGFPHNRVAFGAEQLGGYDWGSVDIAAIERAALSAVENGVTFFDTADCYGRGESERRLGKALNASRSRVFVATKFGVRFDSHDRAYYDNDPDYAERALESSLNRLATDYVDLFQVHWPDGHTPLPKLLERLERIREGGRIRNYGVCNAQPVDLLNLSGDWPGFATFSLQYSLSYRKHEAAIRELCAQRGLIFLSWGSLGHGMLTGKYGKKSVFLKTDRRSRSTYENFHGEQLEKNIALVEAMRAVASKLPDVSVSQLAVRYVLESISHSIVLVGIKNEQQLKDNVKALSIPFNSEVFVALEAASQWALRA